MTSLVEVDRLRGMLTGRLSKTASPTIACIEGDHEKCSGEHPRVGSYTGPTPKCGCGCHIDPWPFPCADDEVDQVE